MPTTSLLVIMLLLTIQPVMLRPAEAYDECATGLLHPADNNVCPVEPPNVFETGPLHPRYNDVSLFPVGPPKPYLVVWPMEAGTYPVILFLHGTYLRNYYYTDLLHHISSHGYIVVAPQLCGWFIPGGPTELEFAAEAANWLASGLGSMLPQNIRADLKTVIVVGHSRGGKTAFALALGEAKTPLKVNISALVGLDPVGGTRPYVLTHKPYSLNLSIPITVIGTGLGGWCAPSNENHAQFYSESKAPKSHLVTKDYGHLDMLNDNLIGLGLFKLATLVCAKGEHPKDPMRRTVGGIVVAFAKAYFESSAPDDLTFLQNPSLAPVELDSVEYDFGKPSYSQV